MSAFSRTVPELLLVQYGNDAGHIAALAELMAAALTADPETALAGEAAEGLSLLARRLSDGLLTLADPNGG